MKSRMHRYQEFIDTEYIDGLSKGDEYSLDALTPEFREWISGGVNRIVFTGMGCSAIVSDVIRGFLLQQGIELDIHVVNDYDFTTLIPDRYLSDPRTLIIVSSYSGYSSEPIMAFERLATYRHRVMLLTSGGRLAEIGSATNTSIARWQLSTPDREYPLFHVTQYFAILVRILVDLGVLDPDIDVDLVQLAATLRGRRPESQHLGQSLAQDARDANVLMMAPPVWHDAMLKLCKMHLNEIAMVPASRNLFHEFCHSEVATLTDPERRHLVLIFADDDSDDYTSEKTDRLVGMLTEGVPQNDLITARVVPLTGATFLEKLFLALDVVQLMTLALARYRVVESRDLISRAAGNPWYHSETILAEGAYA